MKRDTHTGVDREGHWFLSMGRPVRDSDIDSLSADGAQEPWRLWTYRVLVDVDKYDPDAGRAWVIVRASGPLDAKNQVRLDHPHAAVLRVEQAA